MNELFGIPMSTIVVVLAAMLVQPDGPKALLDRPDEVRAAFPRRALARDGAAKSGALDT